MTGYFLEAGEKDALNVRRRVHVHILNFFSYVKNAQTTFGFLSF